MKKNKCYAILFCVIVSLLIMSFCRTNAIFLEVNNFTEFFNISRQKKYYNTDEGLTSFEYFNRITTNLNYYEFEKIVKNIERENEMEKLSFVPINPYSIADIKGKGKILLYGSTDFIFENYYKKLMTTNVELTADSVFISETLSDKYNVGDKIILDIGDKKITATVGGFIEKNTLAFSYDNMSSDELFANENGLAVMAIGSVFDMSTHIFDYSLNLQAISTYYSKWTEKNPSYDSDEFYRHFSDYVSAIDGIGSFEMIRQNTINYSTVSKSTKFNLKMMLCIALLFFSGIILYFSAKNDLKFQLILCGVLLATTLLFTVIDYFVLVSSFLVSPPAQTILMGFLISLAVGISTTVCKIIGNAIKNKGTNARIERRIKDETQ